jgi:hypothetical protein
MIDLLYRLLRPKKAIEEARHWQTLINDQHTAITREQMYAKKLAALEGQGKRSDVEKLADEYGGFFK